MKIFFSHSSTDKALVREIKSKMYDFLDIWLDEKELIVGESLEGEISKAINNADYMVLFISKKALESDWVNKEIELALEKEKKIDKPFILPILLGECMIPNSLEKKLYLNLRTQKEGEIAFFSNELNKELFKLSIKYPLNNIEPENLSVEEETSINPLNLYVTLLRKTVSETKEEYISILTDNINLNSKIIIILIEEKAKEILELISEKQNIVEMLENKDLKIQAIQADTWLDINKKFAEKLLNKINLIKKNNNVISSEEGLMIIKQTIESL